MNYSEVSNTGLFPYLKISIVDENENRLQMKSMSVIPEP